MTQQELQAVADALAEALGTPSVAEAIARIDARCEVRRDVEREAEILVFCLGEHDSRQAGTLGLLGDTGARQRLVAAGVLS